MNTFSEILILSGLYIAVAGLFILLVRMIMQIFGCSTVAIYKLWWIFLLGFVLIFVLQLNNPYSEMTFDFAQSIEMPTVSVLSNQIVKSDWKNTWLTVLIVISAILLFRLIWNYLNLRKRLHSHSVQQDGFVKTAFINTPVAFGFFKSKVYVPIDFENKYTKVQQELLLKHETIHCNRYDPLLLIIYKFLMALFWFHPIVYVLNYYMKKDLESSCDEMVLKTSQQLAEYAKLLLELNQQVNPLVVKTELYCSSSSMLKERIMLIKNLKPKSIFNKIISKSLLLVTTAGLIVTTTVLADMVQVPKDQQKSIEVPKPPKPDAVSASKNQKGNEKHIGMLVPQLDTPKKHIGISKPNAPQEPTPKKSAKLESNSFNKLVPLSTPRPNYPRKAAIAKVNGYVVVEFDVMTDGSVKNPLVIESEPKGVFNQEAVKSVEKYKFKPLAEKMRVRRKVEFAIN